MVNHVITHGRLQPSVSVSHAIDCFAHISDELFEVALVIKVRVGEALIGQQHRGSTVYNVVDKYLVIFQAVAEWLDFVRDPKSKIMDGQRNPNDRPIAYQGYEFCNIDGRAYIEVGICITDEEFKQLPP